jgi:Tol biopolymer transport system component
MKKLAVLVLTAVVGAACGGREKPVKPQAGLPVDLSALKPQFEFRGRIVFQSDLDGDNEIYLLTREGVRRLTDNAWSDEFPRWSPDGRRVAFVADPSGRRQVYLMNEDGSGIRQATRSEHEAIEPGWFPDGRRLAYTEERKRTIGRSYEMFALDLETGRAERLLPKFDGSNALPDFSPAAPHLAFTGKKTVGWGVYLADLLTGESRVLTSGGGACRPRFSPDGRELVYVSSSADGKGDIWLMKADGTGQERLTELPETYDYFPAWSPDAKYAVFASGTKHYPHEGTWSLALVKIGTKRVVPLFRSGARDVFPDWR